MVTVKYNFKLWWFMFKLKKVIKNIPLLGSFAVYLNRRYLNPIPEFTNSEGYWNDRYNMGLTSGDGSYSKLAEFKADFLNKFVLDNEIVSVIEFGSGDGNQLSLANYPKYLGFDVSNTAIDICRTKFKNDSSKSFNLVNNYANEKSDLSISLDVIYHLIEDDVYHLYMKTLFSSSNRYVIIYSSNFFSDESDVSMEHVKHRKFTDWTDLLQDWELVEKLDNIYPYNGDSTVSSFADFYVFKRHY